MRTDKMNIQEFTKHHNETYHYYCEAIIHPDGDISYCVPSHQEKLINETNIPREALWEICPLSADVMLWLVEKTNCVSVWYNMYIIPSNLSCAQFKSLKALHKAECINPALKLKNTPGYHN